MKPYYEEAGIRKVPTYTATIYLGFKERSSGEVVFSLEAVNAWLQQYVNRVGLCVSVTPTEFIYTDGGEPGVAIGLINYGAFIYVHAIQNPSREPQP